MEENSMKKGKLLRTLFVTGMMTAALTGCGGASDAAKSAPMAYEAESVYGSADYDGGSYTLNNEAAAVTEEIAEEAGEYDDAAQAGGAQAQEAQDALAGRKLIKNVNLSVETEQFDVLVPNLEKRVTALGGYIEDMSSYNRNDHYSSDYVGTKYLRYASMTVRIPKENLDAFLNEVGEQSNIVSRSENVTDVTLQYVDLESHKKALTTEQDRLIELMEQAETVEDIITIEGRLSEVRYQLESMESQLRTYDNKIDYSTVYLNIDEVERYTPTEEVTTGERIRNGFVDSLKGVGRGIGNFAIWFVVNLPYLVVWAVIIICGILVVRLVIRKLEKSNAKKAAKRVTNPYYIQNPYQIQNVNQEQNTNQTQNMNQAEKAGETQNAVPESENDSNTKPDEK